MATKYQIGETIRLTATITDINEAAVNPATVKIAINKPRKIVAAVLVDMTNPTVGLYYYDYLIPSDTGVYKWKVTATGSEDRITIVKDSFTVEKSI